MEDDDWDTGTTNLVPPATTGRDRVYLVAVAGDNLGEMHEIVDEVVIGRGAKATLSLRDDGVSRAHARVRKEGDRLLVEDLDSRNGVFVNSVRVEGAAFLEDGDKVHIGHRTVLRVTYHDALDDSFQRQLFEAAMYDALTHAHSRRYFMTRLEAELRFALRHGVPLALVLFDLDHFKEINDRHGHPTGDRVLVEVSTVVRTHVRVEDCFGRLGGDEFGVLCRGAPLQSAAGFAERMRGLIAGISVDAGDGVILRPTVSVGVAALPDAKCQRPEDLLDAADRAMYLAKGGQRNKVALHQPVSTPRSDDYDEETHFAAAARPGTGDDPSDG